MGAAKYVMNQIKTVSCFNTGEGGMQNENGVDATTQLYFPVNWIYYKKCQRLKGFFSWSNVTVYVYSHTKGFNIFIRVISNEVDNQSAYFQSIYLVSFAFIVT